MAELLVELLCEEIPARMQSGAADNIQKLFEERLKEVELSYSSIRSYVTPRRLTVAVEGIPTEKKDRVSEKKGPKTDAPEQAIEGFLKSNNLTLKELEKRATPKGEFYFSSITEKGGAVAELLPELIESAIAAVKWPKSMRWGAQDIRWVRPIESICCLFNGEVLNFSIGAMQSSNVTKGHRFLSNDNIVVGSYSEYQSKLKKAYVILDKEERAEIILKQAKEKAAELGLQLKEDIGLLNELAGLVEYPVVLVGKIDQQFLDIPQEVLICSMRSHQKYFSLLHDDGTLAPYFIVVSNMKTPDNEAQIIAGNERVLQARLSDAMFFWNQDRQYTLESRQEKLQHIIFHEKLGTVADKVKRMTALAKLTSVWIPHANLVQVERSARLAKNDLTTQMVGEFPELQGIMGSYYARHDGEEEAVVKAILSHYRPQGPSDAVPTEPETIAVALADKVDLLVGLFAAKEQPTGSKDPYALRRAALGIIRIILDNQLRIPLKLLFEKSVRQFPKTVFKPPSDEPIAKKIIKKAVPVLAKDKDAEKEKKVKLLQKDVIDALLVFFAERLRVLLKENNVRHDLIAAVFDGGNEDDLYRLVQRVESLQSFIKSEDGENLLGAYRRATNIVRIEEKKDGLSYGGKPNSELLTQKEEKNLYRALKVKADPINKAVKKDDFETVMKELSELRTPIDQFFDQVTVNSSNAEVRTNRLKLLAQISSFLNGVANFEKIEG